jgi:hypothetical protein
MACVIGTFPDFLHNFTVLPALYFSDYLSIKSGGWRDRGSNMSTASTLLSVQRQKRVKYKAYKVQHYFGVSDLSRLAPNLHRKLLFAGKRGKLFVFRRQSITANAERDFGEREVLSYFSFFFNIIRVDSCKSTLNSIYKNSAQGTKREFNKTRVLTCTAEALEMRNILVNLDK